MSVNIGHIDELSMMVFCNWVCYRFMCFLTLLYFGLYRPYKQLNTPNSDFCSCIHECYTSAKCLCYVDHVSSSFHLFQGKIDLLKDAKNEWNLRILHVDQSFTGAYTCIKDNKEVLYAITLKINGKRI